METLFGAAWDDLTPDIVDAFLANAGSEPLRWEAKADDQRGRLRARDVAEAICAFANSELGGYLVIGAKQATRRGAWTMPGLQQPPAADLTTWVGQIASTITPAPMVDVRDFPASAARGPTAVVWIPPIAEPPAMTADGGIYVRVAGASPAVTDPRVLAELFGRGQAARLRAEAAASAAIATLGVGPQTYAIMAFAATGGPRGFASPLFTRDVVEATERAAVRALDDGRAPRRPSELTIHQDWVTATAEMLGSGPKVTIAALRAGAVCVRFESQANTSGSSLSMVIAREWPRVAWEAAWSVLQTLDASGGLFVSIGVNYQLGSSWPSIKGGIRFEDWTALGPPDADELARIERELRRGDRQGVLDDDPT